MTGPGASNAATQGTLFSTFRIFTIRPHCEVANILSWTAGRLLDDLADIEPFRCNLQRYPLSRGIQECACQIVWLG
jgi:hypothetical protein